MSSSSQKSPSVASVQPYSRPANQTINPVMSPHLMKKKIIKELPRSNPPISSSYFSQRYSQNHPSISYSKQTMQPFQQNPPPPISMSSIGMNLPTESNISPQMTRPTHHPPQYMPGTVHQTPQVMREQSLDQTCYCADCMNPAVPPPQVKIPNERQKVEDEILLRQRELDSCWQEDELDYPMVICCFLYIITFSVGL